MVGYYYNCTILFFLSSLRLLKQANIIQQNSCTSYKNTQFSPIFIILSFYLLIFIRFSLFSFQARLILILDSISSHFFIPLILLSFFSFYHIFLFFSTKAYLLFQIFVIFFLIMWQLLYFFLFSFFKYNTSMKKYQILTPITETLINKKTLKGFYKQKNSDFTSSHVVNTLADLIQGLRVTPKNTIQAFVDFKTDQFISLYNLDFDIISSPSDLKYLLFSIIEFEHQKMAANHVYPDRLAENIYPMMKNTAKGKKTNIYIDFDFTQFLKNTQDELDEKQKIIEKLQDVMIDKDNEIDILEDENEQLKKQIQDVVLQNSNQNARIENQKQGIKGKINEIQDEKKKLQDQIKALKNEMKNVQQQNQQQPEQFLRRCLLIQAISIEHFIDEKK